MNETTKMWKMQRDPSIDDNSPYRIGEKLTFEVESFGIKSVRKGIITKTDQGKLWEVLILSTGQVVVSLSSITEH